MKLIDKVGLGSRASIAGALLGVIIVGLAVLPNILERFS